MFRIIFHFLFILLLLYSTVTVLYVFFFSFVAKYFYRKRASFDLILEPKQRIAILIPAYKEDRIILSTVHNLLGLDYPAGFYDIYVIADSFDTETLRELGRLPVNLLEVSFQKSTKAKALNKAFERIKKSYNIALICDADNMLSKDFLRKINNVFVDGAKAVQGRRVAKNLDTSFAVLDGSSEAINNHIFRRGANAVGLSSSLAGSGMAFQYDLIKEIMKGIDAVGGFDKVLQLKLVEKGITIQYLDDAFVFDEKVEYSTAFELQRNRWLSSQFIHFRKFFFPALRQFFKGNFNYFNLAILNNILLPKAIMFILLFWLGVFSYFIAPEWLAAVVFLTCLYVLSIVLAVPRLFLNKKLLKALTAIPKATLIMFGALFQLRKANKTFIHTIHTKQEISTTLFNDNGN